MKTRFGNIPQIQWDNYRLSLAQAVFLPLPFYEDSYEQLEEYFDSLLLQLYGLNELLQYHEDVITIITLLEGARRELHKEDFNVKVYRKSILDAFNLTKKIGGV